GLKDMQAKTAASETPPANKLYFKVTRPSFRGVVASMKKADQVILIRTHLELLIRFPLGASTAAGAAFKATPVCVAQVFTFSVNGTGFGPHIFRSNSSPRAVSAITIHAPARIATSLITRRPAPDR